MCEYCTTGLNMVKEFEDGLEKYLWIEDGKLVIEIHSRETGKSYIDYKKASYCPVCGCKLT